mmetsp:Transcript_6325/g.17669  ORF Transcript_6325/g.17669 Transcript_6325/m.17669 type:complete len:85 (-) Transcript_6325:134-388(-)
MERRWASLRDDDASTGNKYQRPAAIVEGRFAAIDDALRASGAASRVVIGTDDALERTRAMITYCGTSSLGWLSAFDRPWRDSLW